MAGRPRLPGPGRDVHPLPHPGLDGGRSGVPALPDDGDRDGGQVRPPLLRATGSVAVWEFVPLHRAPQLPPDMMSSGWSLVAAPRSALSRPTDSGWLRT